MYIKAELWYLRYPEHLDSEISYHTLYLINKLKLPYLKHPISVRYCIISFDLNIQSTHCYPEFADKETYTK